MRIFPSDPREQYRHTRSQRHPPQRFDNRHVGHPGFVIGGGPSLRPYLKHQALTAWLQQQVTVGVNRAYEWFTPTYLVVGDKWFLNQYTSILSQLPCLTFVPDNIQQVPLWANMVVFYKDARGYTQHPASLGQQISCSNNTGTIALRIAGVMGCNPIYLLGVDLQVTEDGQTHFHTGYGPQRQPSAQRFGQFRTEYCKAITELDRYGIQVRSCSAVSSLNTVIPYDNLERLYHEALKERPHGGKA